MKSIIQRNYNSIIARGLITQHTTFDDFIDKAQEELNELKREGETGKNIGEEIADNILTHLNFAEHLGIDVKSEMNKKIEINFERAKTGIRNGKTITRGKIELSFKNGFYTVENLANKKNRTVTQGTSFESALQAFFDAGKVNYYDIEDSRYNYDGT